MPVNVKPVDGRRTRKATRPFPEVVWEPFLDQVPVLSAVRGCVGIWRSLLYRSIDFSQRG